MARNEYEGLREGSAMSETGLLPAYLIVGTDGVKRDHAVSRMKARLEKSGMVEFNLARAREGKLGLQDVQ